jgi:hypothetical protein
MLDWTPEKNLLVTENSKDRIGDKKTMRKMTKLFHQSPTICFLVAQNYGTTVCEGYRNLKSLRVISKRKKVV